MLSDHDQEEPMTTYDRPTLRASSAAPCCNKRYVVDLYPVLQVKPLGTYSIAGAWPKVVATETWEYRCTNCGATGAAAAPIDRATLDALPRAACGHVVAAFHYPGGDNHRGEVCPGCCPGCQAVRDTEKGLL
jgi:hypothetical protein